MEENSNLVLYIVGAVIGGGIIAFIVYTIISKLKGSVSIKDIVFDVNRPDEGIIGKVSLLTKKSATSEGLFITLQGTRHYKNSNGESESDIIYDKQYKIADAQSYRAGETNEYDFKISFPKEITADSNGIAEAAGMAFSMLVGGGSRRTTTWKLKTNLDLPGVDISSSEKISF